MAPSAGNLNPVFNPGDTGFGVSSVLNNWPPDRQNPAFSFFIRVDRPDLRIPLGFILAADS